FATLVERHGRMVYGACRRGLADWAAAEDALPATLPVLAQKPGAVWPPERLGAPPPGGGGRGPPEGPAGQRGPGRRGQARGRAGREQDWAVRAPRAAPAASADLADVRQAVDQALDGVPGRHRAAVVLCDLENRSRAEAAAELGLSEGTLSSRLARGRRLLARALTARGVTVPAAAFAVVWSGAEAAAVPPALLVATLASAARWAAGLAPQGSAAEALAQQAVRALAYRKAVALIVVLGVTAAVGGVVLASLDRPAPTVPPAGVLDTRKEKHILKH